MNGAAIVWQSYKSPSTIMVYLPKLREEVGFTVTAPFDVFTDIGYNASLKLLSVY